jgi:hypothetical protein
MVRKLILQRVALVVVLALAMPALAANIPAGTAVSVRNDSELSSGSAKSGDTWHGTLVGDLVVNGKTLARNGAAVTGRVVKAKSSGRLSDPGELTLKLVSINGISVSSSTRYFKGSSHTKSNVAKIGGVTAAGALIGGLAGGGKGAAIGAGAGAAAGTGVAAGTGKKEAVVPAESVLDFTVSTQ